jgi:hypothetical protein
VCFVLQAARQKAHKKALFGNKGSRAIAAVAKQATALRRTGCLKAARRTTGTKALLCAGPYGLGLQAALSRAFFWPAQGQKNVPR